MESHCTPQSDRHGSCPDAWMCRDNRRGASFWEFPSGGAVYVAGDTLSPIARSGQWALLADAGDEPHDGHLVALCTTDGDNYLRRIWSKDDSWLLEAVNPLAGTAPVTFPKDMCAVRRIIGVSYVPEKKPARCSSQRIGEWQPRKDFHIGNVSNLKCIEIKGSSLEPIAFGGQFVLVDQKLECGYESMPKGIFAAVETDDDCIGNVIERATILRNMPVHS